MPTGLDGYAAGTGKVLAEAIGEFKTAADLFAYYADLMDATETLPPRQGRTIEANRPAGIAPHPWNFQSRCWRSSQPPPQAGYGDRKTLPTAPLSTSNSRP